MSDWSPGKVVRTTADVIAWESWKLEAKRERQRSRRRMIHRIDYETSMETARFLAYLQKQSVGASKSRVLDAIVARWAKLWLDGQIEGLSLE